MSNLVDENGNEIGKPEQFDMNLYQNTNETILVNLTDKVAGYEEGFKDGAEYGYNKAFVEADKNLKAIVTDFNKAKEIVKKFLEFVNYTPL